MTNFKYIVTTMNEKLTAVREEFKAEVSQILHNEYQNLFLKYPDLRCIWWNQYVPSFNDGDPCNFARTEPNLVMRHSDDEEEMDFDEDDSDTLITKELYEKSIEELAIINEYRAGTPEEYFAKHGGSRNTHPSWITTASDYYVRTRSANIKSYEELIKKFPDNYVEMSKEIVDAMDALAAIDDDILESIFGENVTVIVDGTGVRTEEYDCGY